MNSNDLDSTPSPADNPQESSAVEQPTQEKPEVSRRSFLRSVAIAGAGVVVASPAVAAIPPKKAPVKAAHKVPITSTGPAPKEQEVRVAIIGPGDEGRNLLLQCLQIPGVRFVALADIWSYSRDYASGILRAYKQPVHVYEDYQDMLAKEPSIDAVIIATPDWMHHEHTIACLKAGKHVYCEKEMSNTIENARKMVETARETGKLLQIGHQRRSNPRYWQGLKLVQSKTLGEITHTYAQWNRSQALIRGWPKSRVIDPSTLQKYGYDSMDQLVNWRWFKKFSGGPMADLGSHQVDVFNWFLRTTPSSVMASGGTDYYKNREWPDNVMAVYVWNTPTGTVRGFYEVLNTTSYGGYYEVFEGLAGSLQISEDINVGLIYPEPVVQQKKWEDDAAKISSMGRDAILLKVGETLGSGGSRSVNSKKLAEGANKEPHYMHLLNFFNAIRHGEKLNCPPEVGFETCVSVLKANEAVAARQTLDFDPNEFKA